jgi:thiosulfate reductase cytochrome b subunit
MIGPAAGPCGREGQTLATEIDKREARAAGPRQRQWIYRHALWVRLGHWINVVCMVILLMSGLQIFNAHPALYWGDRSTFGDPVLSMGAEQTATGEIIGVTTILGHEFDTTGVLGLSEGGNGEMTVRGFPAWATIPSVQWLAMGRRWHFFFAWLFAINGIVYVLYAVLGRHLRRDLLPSGGDLRHIGRSILEHLRFRFPKGEAARRYNVLQKIAYLVVLFGLAPLIILTGLTMSPRIDAGFPVLLTIFGGRQSARTIHFICAFSFLLFALVHIFMVLVSGVWNNLRSMITGRYVIDTSGEDHER